MSLIQELEDLIKRTGSHRDREILQKALEQLKKNSTNSSWGFYEEKKTVRR
jgi:hypothetical protein